MRKEYISSKNEKMEYLLSKLQAIAIDLSQNQFSINYSQPNVALICMNMYANSPRSLGIGPIYDGLGIATLLKQYGFQVCYLLNCSVLPFQFFLKKLLSNGADNLVVYFSGVGDNNDEESISFSFGNLYSHELVELIAENKTEELKFIILMEALNATTVCNFENSRIPPNCISFSRSVSQSALINHYTFSHSIGVFTHAFIFYLRKSKYLNPTEIKIHADKRMKVRGFPQAICLQTSSIRLLSVPLSEEYEESNQYKYT
jgi:predicted transcriptional regulator